MEKEEVMFKVFLLFCWLAATAGMAVGAEGPIKCYVNPDGDVIYSNRKCPEGYFEAAGMLALSAIESKKEKEYTPIVPVESTAGVALFEKESQPGDIPESISYHDKNGNLTMVFNDGFSHGQEWGYFNRRYYGLYRCDSGFYDHSCYTGGGYACGLRLNNDFCCSH
jgi:hypothetical protein